jgi:molybdopterin synthase catalytic subunit
LERLKFELPVWKRETFVGGDSGWVGPDARSAETGLAEEVPEWRA